MILGTKFRRSSIRSSVGTGFIFLSALLLVAGVASAREEVLRWTHPDASGLARFQALVGSSPGNYGAPISLGLPQPDAQGVYSASISVADDANVYVAMQAVDSAGVASFPSNERYRPSPTAPPPDGGSGGTSDISPTPTSLAQGVQIPADPNATLRFDFNSGTASNWLDTESDNSMTANDTLFTVGSVGNDPALRTTSTATNIHSHFVGSPNNLNNLVYTGRMATDDSGGGVGVTAYSQYPTADIYYRLRSERAGNPFVLAGHPHNCSGNDNTGVVLRENTWYEFELSITNESVGTRISAKVWKQGDSKPSSAQAECVDSSPSRNLLGTIGVWSMRSGGKYWDDLQVVTAAGDGSGSGSSGPIAPPRLIEVIPLE